MLLEELGERWNWDVKGVLAIVMNQMVNLFLALQTLGLLEHPNLG
jgi:hypothetical protein